MDQSEGHVDGTGSAKATTIPQVHRRSLEISELPVEMQDLMREFDRDGSGGLNITELHAMISAYKDSKRQQKLLQVVLTIVLFALVLSSAATFGVSYAAVELAKDTAPNADGVLVLSSTGDQGENRPALSPEFTITEGVEVAEALVRRMQGGFAEDSDLQGDFAEDVEASDSQGSYAEDSDSQGGLILNISESRVAETCNLFHQGAASNLVISIYGDDFRVSPTRFHSSCMLARGTFDGGSWTLGCPGDNEDCNIFVSMPPHWSHRRLRNGRLLERSLMGKTYFRPPPSPDVVGNSYQELMWSGVPPSKLKDRARWAQEWSSYGVGLAVEER